MPMRLSGTAGLMMALVVGYLIGSAIGSAAASLLMPALKVPLGLAGGLAGAGLGWLSWRRRSAPLVSDVHGSARMAEGGEVDALFKRPAGLIVGRARAGWFFRHDGPGHLLTVAPTRSGKGVGAIVPNLLDAKRSVLVIDPKGENARITARRRESFGPVHVLDPFGICGRPTAAFNPLAGLDPQSLDLAEDAQVLADALVQDAPGQGGEAHWNEEAKALIAGIILYVVCEEPPPRRTLPVVRELLTLAPRAFADLLDRMADSGTARGLVARAANRQMGKDAREAAGVLSSAQRHTHFLDSPRMAQVLERSDFRFADLKSGTASVYLVLPPDRLDAYARWLRLMVAQALTEMARSDAKPPAPVLFLLDEFAALGRLEAVERAFGLMAGYGVQLWPMLQDLHQLKAIYRERWGTFLSNAGLVQVFNVADVETAEWVSKSLGATTIATEHVSASVSNTPKSIVATRGHSTSIQLTKRELMTPDEVMRLDPALAILLPQGQRATLTTKVRYYDDPAFAGMFDPA